MDGFHEILGMGSP